MHLSMKQSLCLSPETFIDSLGSSLKISHSVPEPCTRNPSNHVCIGSNVAPLSSFPMAMSFCRTWAALCFFFILFLWLASFSSLTFPAMMISQVPEFSLLFMNYSSLLKEKRKKKCALALLHKSASIFINSLGQVQKYLLNRSLSSLI